MSDALFELLKELSESDAVAGREDEVRAIFERRWKPLGEVRHDGLGSVIVERPGPVDSPRVALFAHMDEVGFMVRSITRLGLLRLVPLGGFWSQALPGHRVRVLTPEGKLEGVIGAMPPHLLGQGDRNRAVDIKDLLVDVGARSRKDVEELGVRPGSFVVPAQDLVPMGKKGSRVMGKAFDDRVGCAVALSVLEEADKLPCTLLGVATVQEEVGTRGAKTAAAVAKPDIAIILEGAPADDLAPGPLDEAQDKGLK